MLTGPFALAFSYVGAQSQAHRLLDLLRLGLDSKSLGPLLG